MYEDSHSSFGPGGLDIWEKIIEKCIRWEWHDDTYRLEYFSEGILRVNNWFLVETVRQLARRKRISLSSGRDLTTFLKGVAIYKSRPLLDQIEYLHVHLVDTEDVKNTMPTLLLLDPEVDHKIHITFDSVIYPKEIERRSPGPTWSEIPAYCQGNYKLDDILRRATKKINAGKGHEPSCKMMVTHRFLIVRQDRLPEFDQFTERYLQFKFLLHKIDGIPVIRGELLRYWLAWEHVGREPMYDGKPITHWPPSIISDEHSSVENFPIPAYDFFTFESLDVPDSTE